MANDSEDKTIYKVVLNHEEQYSTGLPIERMRWVGRYEEKRHQGRMPVIYQRGLDGHATT